MTGSHVTAPLLVVDPLVAAHLASALTAHLRHLRADGLPVPAAVAELHSRLSQAVRSGQGRTALDVIAEIGDGPSVSPRLLTLGSTAVALSCSERQVRRLITTGDLPAVMLGSSPRVRLDDLDAYVSGLPQRCASRHQLAALSEVVA
jgi:excisionase family DNA binding protein